MPPKGRVPSFADSDVSHVATIAGRSLRFYPIGAFTLCKLEVVAADLWGAFSVLFRPESDAAAREAALIRVVEVLGKDPVLVGHVLLDSLRDEEWNVRPAPAPLVDEFLGSLDGSAMTLMLTAVVHVNMVAVVPLLLRLMGVAPAPLNRDPEPSAPADGSPG